MLGYTFSNWRLLVVAWIVVIPSLIFGQQQLGSVVGQLRLARGDFPSENLLISLEFRGSQIESAYSDSQGRFGFYNLNPNPYWIIIHDEHYEPVTEVATVNGMGNGVTMVNVTLVPVRQSEGPSTAPKLRGANPNSTDVREYSAHFPKAAVKEFNKGNNLDKAGKKGDAIRHYQKAIEIAPGFYAAHNNLGSSYLSASNFAAARTEFEEVVRLNQSDANAYFNLSNVCLLLRDISNAQGYLNEGLRREPGSALGHFLLGSLNLQLGKLPEAESALRETIKLNPLMVQARLQLVNLLLRAGKKTDAIGQLQDFIGSFPASPFVPRAKQILGRLQAAGSNSPRAN